MECHNCYYVVAPGEAAEQGACPKCHTPFERPELDQPSPTTTDFQAFGMPDPGEDDGNQGNPLAEGVIMGSDGERGFRNRDNFMSSRRFDILAPWWHTAEKIEEEEFIPMDQVDVLEEDEVPDKREDRKLKNIEASGFSVPDMTPEFVDDAAGTVQDVAQDLTVGDSVGPEDALWLIPGTGVAKMGVKGLGALGAGKALGKVAPKAAGGAAAAGGVKGALGKIFNGARAKGSAIRNSGLGKAMKWGWRGYMWPQYASMFMGGAAPGMMGPGGGGGMTMNQSQPVRAPNYYSFHQALADSVNQVGVDHIPGDTEDPEEVDQKEHNDGEHTPLDSAQDVNDIGGTLGIGDDLIQAIDQALPKLLNYFHTDDAGEEDPDLQPLFQRIDAEAPHLLQDEDDESANRMIVLMLGGDPDDPGEYEDRGQGHDPMNQTPHDEAVGDRIALQQAPLQGPANTVLRPDDLEEQAQAMKGRCVCGATIDPSQPNCAQCGTPTGGQIGQGIVAAIDAAPMPFEYEMTEIPPDMTIQDWKTQGRPVYCDTCQQPTVDRDSRACNNCGATKMAFFEGSPVPQPIPATDDYDPTQNPYRDHQCVHCRGMGWSVDPVNGTDKYACDMCGGSGVKDGNLDHLPIRKMKMADTQGPNTDEQKAAVAEYLQQQGRGDEIPQMIVEPWNYADILAEIIGREDPPEGDPQEQAPQPPVEAAPPGATMPMPGMGGPPPGPMPGMVAAINKYAAPEDHIQEHGDNFDNQLAVPASDEVHQENVEQEQDTGHTWMDENGEPLRVGQEYELFSDEYDIPDLIRVEAVKPDSLEYTLTGEYGLDHRTEIDHEEAQLYNYSFRPAQADHAEELGQQGTEGQAVQQDVAAIPTVGQDQTDLSTPHQVAASTSRDWLKEGGARFTPFEQREFIEEAGVARNADKLNLSGTHYESHAEADSDYFLFGL